ARHVAPAVPFRWERSWWRSARSCSPWRYCCRCTSTNGSPCCRPRPDSTCVLWTRRPPTSTRPRGSGSKRPRSRSEEHTSELQSPPRRSSDLGPPRGPGRSLPVGTFLVALGTFLLTVAVLLPLYVHERVAVLPAETRFDMRLVDEEAAYLDSSTWKWIEETEIEIGRAHV